MSDTRGPIATEGIYDGKPSLTLSWRADSPYPFSFGVTKARLILACLAEIQAFADKHPDEGKGNRGRGRPAAQRQPRAESKPCACGFCPACLERAGDTGNPLYGLGAPATPPPQPPERGAPQGPHTYNNPPRPKPTNNDEPPC